MSLGAVLVIAKEPVPGRVKTRLVPPCTPVEAADVAAAALSDTLAEMARVPAAEHVVVLDGTPGRWLPAGWRVLPQCAGGLDLRLAAAFGHVDGPAMLVGMDTPQLRAEQVSAFDPDRFDSALGLCADGGYWAIGFRSPADAARTIPGVPMSVGHTAAAQTERLAAANLSVQLLDTLVDVDTAATAALVAATAPHTRFAAAWSALTVEAAR